MKNYPVKKVPELSYQIYSDFKNSNWFIYWDKEYAYTKDSQLLVVWYINQDSSIHYDYVTLKKLLENKTAQNGLPYLSNLSEIQIEYFTQICSEFIFDIDYKFRTE